MEAPQTIRTDTVNAMQQRMQALRIKLDDVYRELLAGSPRPEISEPDILEHIDWCVLEWRWVESQIARQASQADRRATAVIAAATQQTGAAKHSVLKWPWYRLPKSRLPKSRLPSQTGAPGDGHATDILAEVIAHSHELLVMLRDYREFLQAQLVLQEAELARQFAQLDGIPIGSGHAADTVTSRIEMLQDLIDSAIGMISSANLLDNKIMVDVEASILALTSLRMELAPHFISRLPLLATLFQRAERGLLSVRGIAHRKAVLDDAFQRKLSTTRQATG